MLVCLADKQPEGQERDGKGQQDQEGADERVGEPEDERTDHCGRAVLDVDVGNEVPDDGKQGRRDHDMKGELDHFLAFSGGFIVALPDVKPTCRVS